MAVAQDSVDPARCGRRTLLRHYRTFLSWTVVLCGHILVSPQLPSRPREPIEAG